MPGYYLLYYDYTQRNQLAHIKDGNNNPVWTYTYDKAGNATNRFGQWGLANGANYGYDELNRIVQMEQGNATEVFARNHYQYDKVNREVATWRDGPQEAAGSKGEHFWYTTNNQMREAWYKADNVWTATPSNWATFRGYTYTPDMLNWSSVNDNGYSVPFVANALNQYTSINGSTPHYDDRFNLDQFSGMQYSHDSANQLTSVSGNGHSASFTYDGLGRCVRRTVDGVTRLFTYDAWNPIIEFDQAGNWKAMNLYGPNPDEILGRYDAARGPLIYKHDKQGNVVFLLNGSNQLIERYTYDAYGTPTVTNGDGSGARSSSNYGNRFMYTGREWIGELGIYDYRHRYYLPSIGRFLETDPTGFDAGDMNLFRYVSDDPTDKTDPTGLLESNDVGRYSSLTCMGGGDWVKDSNGMTAWDFNQRGINTSGIDPNVFRWSDEKNTNKHEPLIVNANGKKIGAVTEPDLSVDRAEDGALVAHYKMTVRYSDNVNQRTKELQKKEPDHEREIDRDFRYSRGPALVKSLTRSGGPLERQPREVQRIMMLHVLKAALDSAARESHDRHDYWNPVIGQHGDHVIIDPNGP